MKSINLTRNVELFEADDVDNLAGKLERLIRDDSVNRSWMEQAAFSAEALTRQGMVLRTAEFIGLMS